MFLASRSTEERKFRVSLSQETIDVLGAVLWRPENTFRMVDAFCEVAEQTHNSLTDFRQACCKAGAEDPWPYSPKRCEIPEEDAAA